MLQILGLIQWENKISFLLLQLLSVATCEKGNAHISWLTTHCRYRQHSQNPGFVLLFLEQSPMILADKLSTLDEVSGCQHGMRASSV